jgi:EAL domain-containing protein (putative c-di-GMP-specific phosphodiesterase class I)
MRRILRSPLGIATLVALASALLGVSEPLGHPFWNFTSKVVRHSPPASIALITLDRKVSWTSANQARLLARAMEQSPDKVVFDANLRVGEDRAGDAALATAAERLGRKLVFVSRAEHVDQLDADDFALPPESIARNNVVALSGWWSNIYYYAEAAPYAIDIGGRSYPTLSTELADVHSGWSGNYYPDISVDTDAVKRIPASRLLRGEVPRGEMAGRKIVISDLDRSPPILYFGHQAVPPIMVDIAGAAGLLKPVSFAFGSLLFLSTIPMIAFVGGLMFLAKRNSGRRKAGLYFGAVAISVGLPLMARTAGVVMSPDCSWILMAVYAAIRLWQKRTRRIQHTSVSGLPNLLALSTGQLEVGRDVVVAVIARYEEILATLPRELHGECAKQIARRIEVGVGTSEIYHGDGGHFAWTEEARPLEVQFSHLEGLRALFAAPLQIGQHTFDTNIRFGLDRNEGLDALTRVNSALASANEALTNGRAVELFEAHRLSEAPWELSLHARIDEGLRNGDIWMAYQSQWDIAENRICGAEALIRWNHPLRGPIAPDAFILQAERAGRIDALTYWVLEQAITAALELNAKGPRFQMSVNLSAQMVDKTELVSNFAEIVRRRGIDPGLLTIEITETSAVRNRPAACSNLTKLRQMGFRLSIDDFGTGEASLAYLADLPSDELKLDRRFVSRILDSERDRVIVASTIGLAHSLGQKVVAEGIEDHETYQMLRKLGCDYAQGFYLGRPQPLARFEAEYDDVLIQPIRRV